MKATLESTGQMVLLDGVVMRVWEGKSESGVRLKAFVARVMVEGSEPIEAVTEIEAALLETIPPEVWAPKGVVL